PRPRTGSRRVAPSVPTNPSSLLLLSAPSRRRDTRPTVLVRGPRATWVEVPTSPGLRLPRVCAAGHSPAAIAQVSTVGRSRYEEPRAGPGDRAGGGAGAGRRRGGGRLAAHRAGPGGGLPRGRGPGLRGGSAARRLRRG